MGVIFSTSPYSVSYGTYANGCLGPNHNYDTSSDFHQISSNFVEFRFVSTMAKFIILSTARIGIF